MKTFHVELKYSYIVPAIDDKQAIRAALDRMLGRTFGKAKFKGMVTTCNETNEKVLVEDIKFDEIDHINVGGNGAIIEGEETVYGQKRNVNRDRTDTKEQDYIHFDSTDRI